MKALLEVLENEGMPNNIFEEEPKTPEVINIDNEPLVVHSRVKKCTSLGIYLGAPPNIL